MKLTVEEMTSIREDFETARSIYPPDIHSNEFMDLLFDAVVINIDGITDRWFADLRTRIDQESKNIVIDEVKEDLNAVSLPEWDD